MKNTVLFPFLDEKDKKTTSLLFWGCRHIINMVFNLPGIFYLEGPGGKAVLA